MSRFEPPVVTPIGNVHELLAHTCGGHDQSRGEEMPIRNFEPDKRWTQRYEPIPNVLEELALQVQALAQLDSEEPDAVWSEYAQEANGCLRGAQMLLIRAAEVRKDHIAKVQSKTAGR